jgi:hypothetical protein
MTMVCKGIVWRISSCCTECWNVVPSAAEVGGHVEKNEWMDRIQVETREDNARGGGCGGVGFGWIDEGVFGWIVAFQ